MKFAEWHAKNKAREELDRRIGEGLHDFKKRLRSTYVCEEVERLRASLPPDIDTRRVRTYGVVVDEVTSCPTPVVRDLLDLLMEIGEHATWR